MADPSAEPPVAAPRVLVIGGLDPCGGAGITADARVAQVMGAFPLTVATCLTQQNRHGFYASHVVGEPVLRGMLRAAIEDGPIHAVKVGMLGVARSLDIALSVCGAAIPQAPVVVDPVLSATAGGLTTGDEVVSAYRRGLAAMALITPNRGELARLVETDARALVAAGPAVLVTDGDGDGDVVEDRLMTDAGDTTFRNRRVDAGPVHGTGCALSTGIAVGLAGGSTLEAACERAIGHVQAWLRQTPRGEGVAPLRIGPSRCG